VVRIAQVAALPRNAEPFGCLLNPSHEKQYDKDDHDDADDPDAAVTKPVAVAAEAAAESTEQEDDENDNEDESERHGGGSFFSATFLVSPFHKLPITFIDRDSALAPLVAEVLVLVRSDFTPVPRMRTLADCGLQRSGTGQAPYERRAGVQRA